MHLSAHEDGRQLVLLDLHKTAPISPNKRDPQAVICGYQAHAGRTRMHKKTALKKTQGCPQNIPVRVLERILPQRHRAAAS